jgi:hypothetical protein
MLRRAATADLRPTGALRPLDDAMKQAECQYDGLEWTDVDSI